MQFSKILWISPRLCAALFRWTCFSLFSSRMWSCGSEDNSTIFHRPWGNWIVWWFLSMEENFWWRLYVDVYNIFRLCLRLVPYDSICCTIIQFPVWHSNCFVSSVLLRNHKEWKLKRNSAFLLLNISLGPSTTTNISSLYHETGEEGRVCMGKGNVCSEQFRKPLLHKTLLPQI